MNKKIPSSDGIKNINTFRVDDDAMIIFNVFCMELLPERCVSQ
ncbi:hypothetical protein BTN49_1729 [Candidatus Enterovibrio escicola]|uniref:Uncharacterized protein n=1 Tax=Candidatus Enterovibrio escicola TaxID=1927127 RepID=A0A2A5T3L7_9GAMM|nr:hypothetical protein BTN49_1729 [Candidatus Enterovibrio escacola]